MYEKTTKRKGCLGVLCCHRRKIRIVDENGADFISNLIYKQQMKTKGLCLA